jgi:2-polyprenyl-6-methoxyphenol hydroxylase-like FAD-dependent oxidoreductase
MKFDVLVVGAGLAGAALAAALRGSNLKVGIVEARPRPARRLGPRIYAISPPTWTSCPQSASGSTSTPGMARFTTWRSTATPAAAWIFGLRQRPARAGLDRRIQPDAAGAVGNGQAPAQRHPDLPGRPRRPRHRRHAARLTLADGRRIEARLVVAADGRDSWVRQAAGIGARNTPYDEKGVVANFRCEKPHRNTPSSGSARMACWPTCRCPTSTCRWSGRPPTPSPTSSSPCRPKPSRAGRRSRRQRLGKLELVTPPRPSAAPDARRTVVKPRLALIGDAAHAIHPLSGHGINLGYQDARVLAGQLAGLPAWRDPGELPVLRAYARARAEETALLQYTTHGLNRLFKPADPLLSGLRNLG